MSNNREYLIGVAGGLAFFFITAIAQPFFSLYAQALGASTSMIGLLVTLRALLPMFIAMPVGQLIDLVGALPMARIGLSILVLSVGLIAASTQIVLLALSQMLLGASIIITASSLQVLVSRGSETERNRSINRYSMAMSAGGMLGPLAGGAFVSAAGGGVVGYRFAFVAATALSMVAAAILFIAARGRKSDSPAQPSGPRNIRIIGALAPRQIVRSYVSGLHLAGNRGVQFGLTGTFLIMFIQAISMSFVPLFLHDSGYGPWVISGVVSLNGLAGIASRVALDRIIRRLGLERLLIAAGCIAASCLIAIPLSVTSIAFFALVVVVLGGAVGMNLPVSIMIMVNDTAESERGKVMGLRLLANRLSQITSPALFGVLGGSVGLRAAFFAGGGFLLAVVLGFGVVAAARRSAPRSAAAKEEPAG